LWTANQNRCKSHQTIDLCSMNYFDPRPQESQAYLASAKLRAQRAAENFAKAGLRPIRTATVIGAGTMGTGITMALIALEIPTTLIDEDFSVLEKAQTRIRQTLESAVDKGKIQAAECNVRMARVQTSQSLARCADSDLIIEAVFEDLSLKKRIFSELNRIAKPGAILATNTSGLDINEIASATDRKSDVIGAHFFSPAHVQRLLEVVRTDDTAEDAIATLLDLGQRMGKIAILAKVYPGFIGNALFRQYQRESHFLLEEGALPYQIDAVQKRFGFAMGLFAVHDMAGNDVGYQTRKAQIATRPSDRRYCDLILSLTEQGRLGQKSGKGWYHYQSGDRTPLRDTEVETWIANDSVSRGFERQPINDNEIIERCLLSMVNEAAKLLELGIAERASDIDLVYTTGYGFPARLGGPLHYADALGLKHVVARISAIHEKHGYWWTPSTLLTKLATQNQTFEQWDQSRE
jgi:3-hydroxyacyl-CoA dehydrogenase